LTAAKIAELQSEIELHKLEASMNLFYAMMNPDKLVHVPKLARKFAKQDQMLNTELRKNYNGLDLSSNLETLLKEAKVEKELAGLKEQLTDERKKREQCEESLHSKSMELQQVWSLLNTIEARASSVKDPLRSTPFAPVLLLVPLTILHHIFLLLRLFVSLWASCF